ncbi:MAG: hypothetical protein DWQ07_03175 [Chloroflexi bacterium]|nr:MAG: hypothetical protein DWQ07_03175 [Chloroflexota bacterium]NOH10788.1 hypothetical protein [Chloroflexota bacterium]
MNCTTEGQQYEAARNLQADRLESLTSPSLLTRVFVDFRFFIREIQKRLPTRLPISKPKYQRTSSLRFH